MIGVGTAVYCIAEVYRCWRTVLVHSVRVCLGGKVSALVDAVSEVPQNSVLRPLLFILVTSELFHIVWNYIVGYTDDTTIYAVIPRPVSRPLVLASPN